jgi:hypothetical protein
MSQKALKEMELIELSELSESLALEKPQFQDILFLYRIQY